ncbi:MAG: CRISPR-associated helicase Cas3' [Anaerolineae bacterium]
MNLTPLPFQRRVADLLLSGRNVILQAPTGAGKTYAALLPFLEARAQGLDFPGKCIYAVPMRTLANQFVETTEARSVEARIQTGERPEDRQLAGNLTFATIDQVLSSFLMTPYSLPYRQANLNAGAVAASYLVFDEFHLFEDTSMLPTTLEMLRMLKGVAPFLLMTATFSRDMLAALAAFLDAVVVPEDDEARGALARLPSQHKTRSYETVDEPLAADAVLAHHQERTLVVCNTVDRAQKLYLALRDHPERGESSVLLLHARFRKEDRARIEQQVRTRFAKDRAKDGDHWIVVATQVIEVGLDITCQALHTELAPANAILQRAGRCARYENEAGSVFVYRQAFDRKGEVVDLTKPAPPYHELAAECRATWEAFSAVAGKALRFDEEQELVSQVHGPRDRRTVEGLLASREDHRHRMNAVLRGERAGGAGDLIRETASQLVIVHDNPAEVAEDPFAYEAFSLFHGSVQRLAKEWLDRILAETDGWLLHVLRPAPHVDEEGASGYMEAPVHEASDVRGASFVVVHPSLATYDPDLGFMPDRGGTYIAQKAPAKDVPAYERYTYRLEPYAAHARETRRQAKRVWQELSGAAARLEARAGWPQDTLTRLMETTALLHDTGKLNVAWQRWVCGYQAAIGRTVDKGWYAHTDRDPDNAAHAAAEKEQGRRPSHAAEGAFAALRALALAAGGILEPCRAAATAIARHHSANASDYKMYQLDPCAAEISRILLAKAKLRVPESEVVCVSANPNDPRDRLADVLMDPAIDDEYLAYALLVRALRLADQAATAKAHATPCPHPAKEDSM